MSQPTRRDFLQSAIATAALGTFCFSRLARGNEPPRLRKAVKFGMIAIEGSVEDKFNLIKSLGFEGVELPSPDSINRDEVVAARDKTGIAIHGVINSVHWQTRLSDSDPAVRAKAVEALSAAIDDARLYGASTVLLVPGKVTNPETENFDQVWARSQEEVRKVLPHAKEANVKIAIEVVWNDFITGPEQLVKYVDEFNDPQVGAYFDVSNIIKYGTAPADWIRALGPRMLKFDFKGYSNEKGWVQIGDGDENWPEVLKALKEINYDGWATAEVEGGGRERLQDVAARMDRCLGLT